jgi:hypothetical protein
MDTTRRAAGLGLLGYGVATTVAFMALGAPGGTYSQTLVHDYLARGHWVTAFALCYLGAFGALGLLVLGSRLRSALGSAGDAFWALSVAATATSVVGWFVDGGVVVSMAEGGRSVQAGVASPVVYTLTETGNLLAVCAPAFFVGAAALLMAARLPMPRWLKVFSAVAGLCGIVAPLYFPLGIFVLWTLVFSGWMVAGGRRAEAVETQPHASLV